jgi:hypothetical protein
MLNENIVGRHINTVAQIELMESKFKPVWNRKTTPVLT